MSQRKIMTATIPREILSFLMAMSYWLDPDQWFNRTWETPKVSTDPVDSGGLANRLQQWESAPKPDRFCRIWAELSETGGRDECTELSKLWEVSPAGVRLPLWSDLTSWHLSNFGRCLQTKGIQNVLQLLNESKMVRVRSPVSQREELSGIPAAPRDGARAAIPLLENYAVSVAAVLREVFHSFGQDMLNAGAEDFARHTVTLEHISASRRRIRREKRPDIPPHGLHTYALPGATLWQMFRSAHRRSSYYQSVSLAGVLSTTWIRDSLGILYSTSRSSGRRKPKGVPKTNSVLALKGAIRACAEALAEWLESKSAKLESPQTPSGSPLSQNSIVVLWCQPGTESRAWKQHQAEQQGLGLPRPGLWITIAEPVEPLRTIKGAARLLSEAVSRCMQSAKVMEGLPLVIDNAHFLAPMEEKFTYEPFFRVFQEYNPRKLVVFTNILPAQEGRSTTSADWGRCEPEYTLEGAASRIRYLVGMDLKDSNVPDRLAEALGDRTWGVPAPLVKWVADWLEQLSEVQLSDGVAALGQVSLESEDDWVKRASFEGYVRQVWDWAFRRCCPVAREWFHAIYHALNFANMSAEQGVTIPRQAVRALAYETGDGQRSAPILPDNPLDTSPDVTNMLHRHHWYSKSLGTDGQELVVLPRSAASYIARYTGPTLCPPECRMGRGTKKRAMTEG